MAQAHVRGENLHYFTLILSLLMIHDQQQQLLCAVDALTSTTDKLAHQQKNNFSC